MIVNSNNDKLFSLFSVSLYKDHSLIREGLITIVSQRTNQDEV
ncbi:hypothetical protein V1477_018687 [Vespula maculifrons]|uniref:Uncharacterized protein n=1 Tax=Vespula maculifrons TaxID=7453 RepID=A0ABD2AW40_VESMC